MENQQNNNYIPHERPPKITKENIHQDPLYQKNIFSYWIKPIFYIALSSLLAAIAVYSLITPNKFTIGGAAGVAIILNVISKDTIPQSVSLFFINMPLLVISFFFVKKRFAILTTINILFQSLWLWVIELLFPDFMFIFESNGEKIFAAVAAAICLGLAITLALKTGGSTGGTDILAILIQKKFSAGSIAWILFTINCIVIGSSLFVFPGENLTQTLLPIMLSIFESYIESKTVGTLTSGVQSAVEFRIITDKPEEMANALMHELSRGVTALPAVGMYTNENHTMLLCVVNRRQITTLKRIMKSIDPDSFAVMSTVSQVLGLGFYTEEISE